MNIDWYHPLLRSADGYTMALAMGLGVKFYSFLADGGSIQSSSFHGNTQQMPAQKIEKLCVPEKLGMDPEKTTSVGETWLYHLAFVEQKLAANRELETKNLVEKFIDAQKREDSPGVILLAIALGWIAPVICLGAAALFFRDLFPF